MVRKRATLFSLKKGHLRQSWNKYNLFNLSRYKSPVGAKTSDTFFKQKWLAKRTTRKYHGEQIGEKQWRRRFSPTLRAVALLNPRVLAQTNGTEESAGRGSGRNFEDDKEAGRGKRTPYANMVFAPLERRLDVAVHRAMFASSVRQARQFCIHGYVKVNGQQMLHPNYALNPGDMFQVDPDRVLFATGQPKDKFDRRETKQFRKQKRAAQEAENGENENQSSDEVPAASTTPASDAPLPKEEAKKTLKLLLSKTQSLLSTEKTTASASRKRQMREMSRAIRKTMSSVPKAQNSLSDSVNEQMAALMQKLNVRVETEADAEAAEATTTDESSSTQTFSPKQKRDLERVLQEMRENPVDPSKPYATPWRPKDYMSPFAFIPRYLEVHHKICSAIYLRHPLAQVGMGEVPTPFALDTNALTHNWYLRQR